MIVFKGMVEQATIRLKLKKMRGQQAVLKQCGLEKESERIKKSINQLVMRDKELDKEISEQRNKSAQALMVCFVAADLATLAADQFADVCNEVNYGATKSDNEFIQAMKDAAAISAKEYNQIVTIYDEAMRSDEKSMFYAEFSEAITDKVLPILNDEIKKVMQTKKGKRWI